MTLSLPSAEEKLESDVVFVLDKSTSTTLEEQALQLLTDLKNLVEPNNIKVKVGVVIFNKIATVTAPLTDLSTGYDTIKTAIETTIKSGSNTHAGLLAGKQLLDADDSVLANRKYMIFVSDGVTYQFCQDDNYKKAYTRSFYCELDPDNTNREGTLSELLNVQYPDKAKNSIPMDNINTWMTDISSRIGTENDNSAWDYEYTGHAPEDSSKLLQNTRNVSNVEKALYLTKSLYESMQKSGYKCYSVLAKDTYPWGTAFMNMLAGGSTVDFSDIKDNILYAVGAGSTVVDTMGAKFDFGGLKTMTLKVGGSKIEGIPDAADANTVNFGTVKSDGTYPYIITYTPATKTLVWTINENVSNFAPVKLTYTVKLTEPETTEGTYGVTDLNGEGNIDASKALYTNESAVLTPKNSQNVEGKPLEFPKPSVSYSVDSSGNPILPIVGSLPILWLNMEDHYSYIVGYPDGTVQPNGKITRAEVATIFFRLLSDDTREAFWSTTNDYSDVTADKWYNNAVSTLSRLGVISGYPDGTFRPDASITRAEFAKIAVSFCKYGSTTYSGCFSDVKASDWFSTCVETAKTSNLIAGYPDGTFRPNNAITRAEACTIVNRTLGRKPAKNHMNISGRINWPDCVDTDWFYADIMEATNSHDYQMVGLVEDWNRKLPQRDWAALETEWSHAYSAPGGEVGR